MNKEERTSAFKVVDMPGGWRVLPNGDAEYIAPRQVFHFQHHNVDDKFSDVTAANYIKDFLQRFNLLPIIRTVKKGK